jgi:hypothetical protein
VVRLQKAALPPMPRPALPPPTHVSPLIRPWFGVARGDDGQSRVTMVWEPARRVTGDPVRTLAPARLKVAASTPEGESLYEGVVVPAGAPAVDGESSQAVFNVPPGRRVRLQMSVEDAASRVLDTDVREVVVGGLGGAVAIATPEVLRARTARDLRTLTTSPDAIPSAAREFSRVEQLVVRLKIYGDQPLVTASLMNRRGQAMRALTVEKGERSGAYTLALPLSGLAAGDYTITLRASAANAEAREVVNFRVTP